MNAIALFESKIVPDGSATAGNVDLVKSILTLAAFEELFPIANDVITSYEVLLTILPKFPSFCKAKGGKFNVDVTPEIMCKRELAAFFAHVIVESSAGEVTNNVDDPLKWGLGNLKDTVCEAAVTDATCNFFPASNTDDEGWMLDQSITIPA